MGSTEDERHSHRATRDWCIRWLANLSIGYPLFLIFVLYMEWWLAGQVLGHPPRLYADDPKYIDEIAGIQTLVALTFLGLIPFLPFATALNVYCTRVPIRRDGQLAVRMILVGLTWFGTVMFLSWDPWEVLKWWLD